MDQSRKSQTKPNAKKTASMSEQTHCPSPHKVSHRRVGLMSMANLRLERIYGPA
jgi:hypothetical protein